MSTDISKQKKRKIQPEANLLNTGIIKNMVLATRTMGKAPLQ
jgi:hypothetical protein